MFHVGTSNLNEQQGCALRVVTEKGGTKRTNKKFIRQRPYFHYCRQLIPNLTNKCQREHTDETSNMASRLPDQHTHALRDSNVCNPYVAQNLDHRESDVPRNGVAIIRPRAAWFAILIIPCR